MADVDSRYDVTITLDITDATTGEPTPFSRTVQSYFDMKYEDMQAVQAIGIQALTNALLGVGNQQAEAVVAKRTQGKAEGQDKTDKFMR